MLTFDYVIIGAGIYGLYTAKQLSSVGYKVIVLEMENTCFSKASCVNQARLHNGYHYPRSLETAIQANTYFNRFQKDFPKAIFKEFDQIYAISTNDSKVTVDQYEIFCRNVGIPLDEVNSDIYFKKGTIQKAYKTLEYVFDYDIVLKYLLQDKKFEICFNTYINRVDIVNNQYKLQLIDGKSIKCQGVFNITYTNINSVNKQFQMDPFLVKYELAEVVLFDAPDIYKNKGLTIMDGEYMSIMPFGSKKQHILFSVKHSVRETCYGELPKFSCQGNTDCSDILVVDCNKCSNKPSTLFDKMLEQCKFYFQNTDFKYVQSIITPKVIAANAEDTDARLVDVKVGHLDPLFIAVHSGKINCIYEIDSLIKEYIC